jgi:ligand-binding SRPBCC domain-containing protein
VIYRKSYQQVLPVGIQRAWTFFSNAENLQTITPKEMKFLMKSGNEKHSIYPGQIIVYSVSPLLKIPLTWVTEITHVNEPNYFVDEQRKGPFTFWHHQHLFKAIDDHQTEMTDILHYEIPLRFIGQIMNSILIEKKIKEIFSHRCKAIDQLLKVSKTEPAF